MMKILLAFAAVLVSASSVAAGPGRAITNWTGFYVGGHAGFGAGDARYAFETDGHYNQAPGQVASHRMNGALAGGHIGYNWQSGPLVFGIEGSVTWSDVGKRVINPIFQCCSTWSTQVDWIGAVTPRFAFTANNWLLYVKGGVAFAAIKSRIDDPDHFDTRTGTNTGWTIGAGIEYAVTPNWIVGIGANYYDFGRCCGGERFSRDIATGIVNPQTSHHSVKTQMWSALGRISYRFGT